MIASTATRRHETERMNKRDQLLSENEEKELVRWITRLTATGYAPRHITLREMAEEIEGFLTAVGTI